MIQMPEKFRTFEGVEVAGADAFRCADTPLDRRFRCLWTTTACVMRSRQTRWNHAYLRERRGAARTECYCYTYGITWNATRYSV